MPTQRLLRSVAASVVLTAALATALVTTAPAVAADTTPAASPSETAPAVTSAEVTDHRDPSCVTDDPRALCASPDSLLDVRIGDVHPTQPSLGYDEVYYKLGRYSTQFSKDKVNKEFDDWCEANGQQEAATVPAGASVTNPSSFTCAVPVGSETADTVAAMKTVVIGPGGVEYLTDGHHTLTSFAEASGLDVHVRLRVLGNLSGLSETAFWQTMQENGWVWLRDVNGTAITPAQLPTNVGLANFQDDRYRSIMYFARDIGYTADGAVPFQEFYWGTWLRGRSEIPVASWDQDDWDASLALVRQITEAQVALGPDTVVDPASGYTAAQLSAFTAWNDGAAETDGEWSKLAAPYSAKKPGKLAYMVQYRSTLPRATVPEAPAAPTLTASGTTLTAAWAAPADGGSAITGYRVTLSDGTVRTVGASERSAQFTDVAPGAYTVTVAALNAEGSSAESAASTAVTVTTDQPGSGTPTPGTPGPGAPTPGTGTPAPGTPGGTTATDPTTVHGTVTVRGSLVAGGRVTVRGSGFAPDTAGIRVELHSDPVLLGVVTTDASGAFTLAATVPASVPVGTHTVVVLVDGVQVGATTVAIGAGPAGELAFTGTVGLGAASLAALALLTAGAWIAVARRRRDRGAATA